MPLINKLSSVSASLANHVHLSGRYLEQAADQFNLMARALLDLSNDDLAAWLNSQPIADLQQLFADHLNAGTQINEAIAVVSAQLTASSIPFSSVVVDVRDFATKLAEQGRTASFDGATWTVDFIPPAPEQPIEPQPE